MTVAQLLRSMSAEEFTEWKIVHDKLDPFGSRLAELQAGSIAAPLFNIQLSKGGRRLRAVDWLGLFLAELDPPPIEPQSPDTIKAIFKGIAEGWKKKPRAPKAKSPKAEKPPTVGSVGLSPPSVPGTPENPAQPKARRISTVPAGRKARRTRADK